MRILAIDHGDARAGTAICDPSETIVRPLGVVAPPEPGELAACARAGRRADRRRATGLARRRRARAGRGGASFAAALSEAAMPGRDLRRAPDHADGHRERPRRGRARRPTRSPPRTCSSPTCAAGRGPRPPDRGRGSTGLMADDDWAWHDPFADDEQARERERRRAEREARRRERQGSLAEKAREEAEQRAEAPRSPAADRRAAAGARAQNSPTRPRAAAGPTPRHRARRRRRGAQHAAPPPRPRPAGGGGGGRAPLHHRQGGQGPVRRRPAAARRTEAGQGERAHRPRGPRPQPDRRPRGGGGPQGRLRARRARARRASTRPSTGPPTRGLEGFLFPATYELPKKATARTSSSASSTRSRRTSPRSTSPTRSRRT